MIIKSVNGYIISKPKSTGIADRLGASKEIEDYANANIPESEDAFGQFMYHAELIKRGHFSVFEKDVKDLPKQFLDVIMEIVNKYK
jgi:hypothetical protein